MVFPLTVTTSVFPTFVPLSANLPFTITSPCSTSLSASLLEQIPASAIYLLIRVLKENDLEHTLLQMNKSPES